MLVISKGSFFSLFETIDSVSLDSGLDFELERADDDDDVVHIYSKKKSEVIYKIHAYELTLKSFEEKK
jgi:hypothetical protein